MMDAKTIDLKSAKTVSMIVEQQDGKIEVLTDSQVRPFLNHLAEQIERMRLVPVSERLPNYYEDVLCITKRHKFIVLHRVEESENLLEHWHDNEDYGYDIDFITHWMPLLARPEGL